MANAVRDNPERAKFLGYSSRWVRFYSFCRIGLLSAGLRGVCFAINYEILTEENLNAVQSGDPVGHFLGGCRLLLWARSLVRLLLPCCKQFLAFQTELWAFYAGACSWRR